jgi:prepilin-type N-terminal cleavage/methylation domain-containing protein
MIERARHDEAGFSLIELLAAMVIGSLVLTVLMTIFISGVKGTTRIQDRVDSSQRARTALDRIVSLLDSQVCVPQATVAQPQNIVALPPVQATSTGSSVTFFADLTGAGVQPNEYKITYDASAKTLTLYTYTASGNTPLRTFNAANKATQLATDVTAVGSNPVFTYYAFNDDGTIATTPAVVPLPAPGKVARVGVQFQALSSTGHVDNSQRAVVSGSGTVSTFNPDSTSPSVCPS